MRIDIVTIFPEMCAGPLGLSMMGRAREKGLLDLRVHDLREWATDRHRRVDDEPYGGGQGMVMKCEPWFAAVEALRGEGTRTVLMTPQGRRFCQAEAEAFAGCGHLVVLCGHYEGIDHRVVEALVDDEISIGDYVLTNGAIAANVFTDAVVRLIPGVLGYTRPAEFRGMKVPAVLLEGNHVKIAAWKRERARERTAAVRPDLLAGEGCGEG